MNRSRRRMSSPHEDAARRLALIVVVLDVVAPSVAPVLLDHSLLALIGLIGVLCLREDAAPALGLRLTPLQGWGYWLRIAGVFALVIFSLTAVVIGVFYIQGWTFPVPHYTPTLESFVYVCIQAPVSEEVIYRALLTFALLPTLGPVRTIIAGGLVFGLIHLLGGNPGPDNLIAGFMLGWAFIHSRTLLVPLAMHAGGNCFAFALHAAAWAGWLPFLFV